MKKQAKANGGTGMDNLFFLMLIVGGLSLPTIYLFYKDIILGYNNVIIKDDIRPFVQKGKSPSVPVFGPSSISQNAFTQREVGIVKTYENAQQAFTSHISHTFDKNLTLEKYMFLLSKSPKCSNKPIFLTMARVSSDLYWQLIENFFYTMYIFGHLECSIMVCVTGASFHGFIILLNPNIGSRSVLYE